jgi:ABC-type phosphate transport system auxiliary subunit
MTQATDKNPIDELIATLETARMHLNGLYFEVEVLRMKADRLEKENLQVVAQNFELITYIQKAKNKFDYGTFGGNFEQCFGSLKDLQDKLNSLPNVNLELKKQLHYLKEQDGRPYKGET